MPLEKLCIRLYLVSKSKAGMVCSMLLELDAETLMGYLLDPPSIRGVVTEAMMVINSPPPIFGNRMGNKIGLLQPTATTSLGGGSMTVEGGHDDEEQEL